MSENQTDSIIPVDDVNTLAGVIVHWHNNRIARIRHMLDIPEGTEVSIDEADPITLEGNVLSAYRLGIHVALTELGELPIQAEYEPNDSDHSSSGT